MDWGSLLLVAVLATGLGYAGGQLAVRAGRRRENGRPEPEPQAAFRMEHLEEQTWALVNVGLGVGSLVSVVPFADGLEHWPPRPAPGHVETVSSQLMPTLAPGESMSVWFSHYDRGQRVIVSWTAENNVRMGPVMLDLPAPR